MIARARNVIAILVVIAVAPLLLASAVRAENEVVSFPVTSYAGDTLALRAKLNKPEGDGPFPAVILLHGCERLHADGSWDDAYPFAAAGYDPRPFLSWGYVTLTIDSFGPRGIDEACEGRNRFVASEATRARDAHAGKTYLANLPFIDGQRIGVIGWSHGAAAAMIAVSNDAQQEPVRDDPFQAAIAFYPYCPFELRRLDAPLLILIGDADTWTRSALCEAMQQVGESAYAVDLTIYPGATHAFDWEGASGFWGTYDPKAKHDAYRRIKEVLSEHLDMPDS